MEQKLFFPGDDVPPEYVIPDRLLEGAEADGGGGEAAPAGDGDGDDELDEGEDEPATEGGGSAGPQPDGAFLELEIDVASASVQDVIDAVVAVKADFRDEAARWVLSEESRRPAPRTTLLSAMRKLLAG